MTDVPKFMLYGDNDPEIDEGIQPKLNLSDWSALKFDEKEIVFQQLFNLGWLERFDEIFATIEFLNNKFLRVRPGKRVHAWQPHYIRDTLLSNRNERNLAACEDFREILLTSASDMVIKMLSKFAKQLIDSNDYDRATKEVDENTRKRLTNTAFQRFDRFANCLNHIFEQFSVNILVTRNGFVPRQDEKITEHIYNPVMQVLSAPKWRTINEALSDMFNDYYQKNYPETITKAHGVIQRFLQILVDGDEGKNAKGEVGKLFSEAKRLGLIPADRFSEPIINVLHSFIVSERATKSTAKPAIKEANPSEALLVMNVVMVFLQHCLHNGK